MCPFITLRTNLNCYLKHHSVVYFDQPMHACACVRMVENDQKHVLFLLIFKCFQSFSTMGTHVQACVHWSKYTTPQPYTTRGLNRDPGIFVAASHQEVSFTLSTQVFQNFKTPSSKGKKNVPNKVHPLISMIRSS